MGTISASGLVSGIDTDNIIEQLIALDQRPIATIQSRVTVLQSQQAAFQNINAQLLGIQTAMKALTQASSFKATAAGTSNESILTATSNSSATPGSYSFLVSKLVASQQTITSGFGDLNTTPLPAGALTFERGEARLDRQTRLDALNGGAGVRRGYMRITDRSGNSAVIDLTRAVTVDDVLNQINNNTSLRVQAGVDGDRLTLTDLSGGAGDLIVANVGTSSTATSLGLAGAVAADVITGTVVNTVGRSTVLATLNDGNGISKHGSIDDFRITTAGGGGYNISLAGATNLGHVIDRIEAETNGEVTAAISSDGLGLVLTDTTGGGAGFAVTALNGSAAASDLGILGDDSDADGQLGGARLTGTINSKLIRNLNGGRGVDTLGTISIQNRAGVTTNIDLSAAVSIADVVAAINNAGAGVTASLNNAGNGLLLTDESGGTGDIVIGDASGTTAADLGLAGTFTQTTTVDSGNLQFKYITEASSLDTLNITRGRFIITDSSGKSATVDLTQGDEHTIGDVIREINSRGLQVSARVNDNGDGILIEDTNTAPIGKMKIEEAGSTTAQDLGLLGEAATVGGAIDGSFEKTITITANVLDTTTLLSTLNNGAGVDAGAGAAFTFTTRDGATHDIDLAGVSTIADLIAAISAQTGGAVTAGINAIDTGLKLTDNTSGSGTFKVEAVGDSTAASDLGILASDNNGDGVIGGGSIVKVTTLQDLAKLINDAKVGVTASIINDGSAGDPYRLSFSSTTTGSRGAFVFDDGGLGFNAVTLAKAQDAVVFFGGDNPANAVALTSSSNTLDGVIPGVNISLKAASSEAVTVTVNKNTEAITGNVTKFVEAFNALINNIHSLDSYDTETKKRGLLLGDSTLAQIESQLFNYVIRRNGDLGGTYTSLSQIGIKVASGATLEFDTAKFQAALANDPESVEALFTFQRTEKDADGKDTVVARGIGHNILSLLDRLTDSDGGVVDSKIDSISRQITQNNDRVQFMQGLLEDKRARLQRQFAAMELALARMQDQSAALGSLSNLASQVASSAAARRNQ